MLQFLILESPNDQKIVLPNSQQKFHPLDTRWVKRKRVDFQKYTFLSVMGLIFLKNMLVVGITKLSIYVFDYL